MVYYFSKEVNMLKLFEVENFMGFKDKLTFDLTSKKKYANNIELVENGIVKKALVFGANGSGKSNLCSALMDITFNLVDKERILIPDNIYCNADTGISSATFQYLFQFDKKTVKYEYAKTTCLSLCYEKLFVNDEQLLEYNYFDSTHNFIKIPGTENLNYIKLPPELSMIKYILNNTVQDEKSVLRKIVNFAGGMLYFKSLLEGNRYMGYKLGGSSLADIILSNSKLTEFNDFLKELGLEYNLVPSRTISGLPTIGVKFGKTGKVLDFSQITSSGTKTLWLFYCWFLEFQKLDFLIIDEFDAYYHYKLSEDVLKMINKFSNFQSVLTTHNTFLMNQNVTRPDCCFVITDKNKITPISKLTNKEIRKDNNLEKMYRDGEFIK